MKGISRHCKERHLKCYLAELYFRYNTRTKLGVDDLRRADNALKGVVGKRLTYKALMHDALRFAGRRLNERLA